MPEIISLRLSGRPKVAVGIPSLGYIPQLSHQAFMFMAMTMTAGDRLLQTQVTAVASEARNTLIKEFLETDCEYLFLFDDDMVVPVNILQMCMAGLPFVSAYCCRKQYPYLPVPSMYRGMKQRENELIVFSDAASYEYSPITNYEPGNYLFECDGVGAAAICVRRDVLEAIEPPWFKFEGGGEDYYFCRKVKEVKTHDAPNGCRIIIDAGVEVGHLGVNVAYPRDFFRVKDEFMAANGESEIDIFPSSPVAAD